MIYAHIVFILYLWEIISEATICIEYFHSGITNRIRKNSNVYIFFILFDKSYFIYLFNRNSIETSSHRSFDVHRLILSTQVAQYYLPMLVSNMLDL
jgi:hypothetical protein